MEVSTPLSTPKTINHGKFWPFLPPNSALKWPPTKVKFCGLLAYFYTKKGEKSSNTQKKLKTDSTPKKTCVKILDILGQKNQC